MNGSITNVLCSGPTMPWPARLGAMGIGCLLDVTGWVERCDARFDITRQRGRISKRTRMESQA